MGKQLRISALDHLRPSVNFEYDKGIEILKRTSFFCSGKGVFVCDNGQSVAFGVRHLLHIGEW